MKPRTLRIAHLLQPGGWSHDVRVALDAQGTIASVAPHDGTEVDEHVDAHVVPGIPNLHSHAFQRLMAGRTEARGADPEDSFWSWRTWMYRFANALSPSDVEAIAAQLYVEMLRSGYTCVGEFHYLHHDANGVPYADPATMLRAVHAAAAQAGIATTLLPVLYAHGGIGQPPGAHQRRFIHADVDAFLRLVETARTMTDHTSRIGVAPHSLRAVAGSELSQLLKGFPAGPVHIHAAEQPAEVDACVTHLGARPVQYLLDQHGVDARWCLVHATHVTSAEVTGLARTGAVAGLCPTTEANLGDGIFPAVDFLSAGGRLGIGSDSHVTVDAAEEIRLLEYGQRLVRGKRNLLVGASSHVGRTLLDACTSAGAQALDQPVGALVPGKRADLVVLDPAHPRLVGLAGDALLDAWLVASGGRSPVKDVMVAGRWVVRDGHHAHEEAVAARYADVARRAGEMA